MNTGIDDNIGLIVSALKQAAMFENTVLFGFNDNGGDVTTGASNHPYRGTKMTP